MLTTRLGNGIAIVFGMHASLILSNLAKNLSAFLIILLFSRVWTADCNAIEMLFCSKSTMSVFKIGCGRKCYGFC